MVRIIFGAGYLELLQGEWHPSTPDLSSLAGIANTLSHEPFYSYSPAHGGYGPVLAREVAGRIGGEVEVRPEGPPQTVEPEGVVF